MIHGIYTGFLVAAELIDHTDHIAARQRFIDLTAAGDGFGIASQVLAEFIHVVTDTKRFANPLSIEDARNIAEQWWMAKEVTQVACDAEAVAQFFRWHRIHGLGRKRLLDTLLAATYRSA